MTTLPNSTSHKTLFLNTLAFTICFAVWMVNGVLVTFLAANQVFDWGPVEVGWLMGIPVLTGALFRLPAGILTDKYGGKPVFGALLLFCAIPMFLLSYASSFWQFALCSFGFGMAGTGFSIGIAYTAVWYPRKNQGFALGVFGAGNAGAAVTTLIAPSLLIKWTSGGENLDAWRQLPVAYALLLLVTGVGFLLLSTNKRPDVPDKSVAKMLEPLRSVRVWRFGLYYFLVFGCFVAFSQWLVPYFVNVYQMSLVTAGLLAALFSFPSGVIRALGGWMSDKFGARRVMFGVLWASCLISLALTVPRMEIFSPGRGIMATAPGTVTQASATEVRVDDETYALTEKPGTASKPERDLVVFPTKEMWQEPVVKVGDTVEKKQLLARGVTRIFFQANVWIFAVLAIALGSIWGIGKAGVYKYIPDYFPNQVGVVGGMVGVLGGLGGFFCPILFGYLLEGTGLWTSCWMLMFAISLVCLVWLQRVTARITAKAAPHVANDFEEHAGGSPHEDVTLRCPHADSVSALVKLRMRKGDPAVFEVAECSHWKDGRAPQGCEFGCGTTQGAQVGFAKA